MFLNTVAFVSPPIQGTWGDNALAVFDKEKEILERRTFPLAEIKNLNDGVIPFDAAFDFVHFHVYDAALNLPGIEIKAINTWEETDFPLLAQFVREPGSGLVRLMLMYDPETIDAISSFWPRPSRLPCRLWRRPCRRSAPLVAWSPKSV